MTSSPSPDPHRSRRLEPPATQEAGTPRAGEEADRAQVTRARRRALGVALKRAGWDLEQLWTACFALGGSAGPVEVEGYLHAGLDLPDLEHDLLALAVNTRLDELAGTARVPYTRPVRHPRPSEGPLAALVTLLQHAPVALGGNLPAAVDAAGRALGVRASVHVVDHERRHLVSLASPAASGERARQSVEGTLAGRAYRTTTTQVALGDAEPRLWVPVLDGAERLGVLEVVLGTRGELHDPWLREQCEWLGRMLGHVIISADQHGDTIDAARRTRARTPAAELIWRLLPPLSTGDEHFMLSGLLEPAYEVGGDVFDYALFEDRVDLAIFDAMGHSLDAGLIASAALAAYRAARREGRSLYDQAAAVDEVLETHFSHTLVMATGVLATLDLTSGRLRYLAAGHPAPLVLREGRVVTSLEDGRRTPFGVGDGELTLGEVGLQPGDAVVLYTDGVVEARDAHGRFFGTERMVDLLERAAAAQQSPRETVRRLIAAVLEHQEGRLQDDATVLIASWGTR